MSIRINAFRMQTELKSTTGSSVVFFVVKCVVIIFLPPYNYVLGEFSIGLLCTIPINALSFEILM